jgi:hypothetical protein
VVVSPIEPTGGTTLEKLAPEAPTSAAEQRAEERSRSAGIERAGGGAAWLPPTIVLLMAASVIGAIYVLWLLVRHRNPVPLYVASGVAVLCATVLVVGLLSRRLLERTRSAKITIHVAKLGGDDPTDKVRELIELSIDQVLGRNVAPR